MHRSAEDAAPTVGLSQEVLAEIRAAVGADGLLVERNQLQTCECDGLAALRVLPGPSYEV
jgi:hypothetical protein